MFGLVVGAVLLPVQGVRIYNGIQNGRMLITDSWYADWSNSPLGFALAFAMHLGLAVFALVLLWYGIATVRHWVLEH